MTKLFEYKTFNISQPSNFELEALLSNLGRDGWEIIHISRFDMSPLANKYIASGLMKRVREIK